jgi:hypothetical protein
VRWSPLTSTVSPMRMRSPGFSSIRKAMPLLRRSPKLQGD